MANQACVTTIFFTAGDSGTSDNTYMQARESGNEAATAAMAGVADQYTEFTATFGGQPVLVRTLVGAPQVQKIWFRLPDVGLVRDLSVAHRADTHSQLGQHGRQRILANGISVSACSLLRIHLTNN